jgi:hypothetical protein
MKWRLEVNGSGCKLCFVKNKGKGFPIHAMKAYKGVEVKLHSFLTLALERERRMVEFTTRPLYPREGARYSQKVKLGGPRKAIWMFQWRY